MSLGKFVTATWMYMQGEFFPALAEAVGKLSLNHQRFIRILNMAVVGRLRDRVPAQAGRRTVP